MLDKLFYEIKNRLDIEVVAKYLGMEIKNHKCICPFHVERTASMRFYQDHFYCFGCNASGDSINLASGVLGVKPIAAAIILNRDFHLGLDLHVKPSLAKVREGRAIKLHEKYYDQWYRAAILVLSEYIKICYDIMKSETSDQWYINRGKSEAERVELLQDSMFEMSPHEAYKQCRVEVNQIDQRLQRGKKLASEIGMAY